MLKVTLILQMSSDAAFETVLIAIDMPGVELSAPERATDRRLVVRIETPDPDVVDIVREIAWEFDPLAIQQSVSLDIAS